MDQLTENNDVLHKDHPLVEKTNLSGVVDVSKSPDGLEATTTEASPYRLYKRRWIGVFAMVSTLCPMLHYLPHLRSADEDSSF
jgi:hypothetical protein